MPFSLFVNFCFFDFKDFDSEKGKIYEIEKNFYKFSKSIKGNITEFEKKIISKKNNSAIFYCGIEQKISDKYKNFYKNNKEKIENFFCKDCKSKLQPFFVKTKLSLKNIGGKSLLSLLLTFETINYNNDNNNYDDDVYNAISKNYYLFPLEFKDFHN